MNGLRLLFVVACHRPDHRIHADAHTGQCKERRPDGGFGPARFVDTIPDIGEHTDDGQHLEADPAEICVFTQCFSR